MFRLTTEMKDNDTAWNDSLEWRVGGGAMLKNSSWPNEKERKTCRKKQQQQQKNKVWPCHRHHQFQQQRVIKMSVPAREMGSPENKLEKNQRFITGSAKAWDYFRKKEKKKYITRTRFLKTVQRSRR